MKNLFKLIVIGLLTWSGGQLVGCDSVNEKDDSKTECDEVAYYGPEPCTDDAGCVEDNGEGWYCDKDHTFGAGDCAVPWALCKEGNVGDTEDTTDSGGNDTGGEVAYYGPEFSCTEDQHCVDRSGEGWYCDKASGNCIEPDSGGDSTDPDPDTNQVAYYGPEPVCVDDQECIDQFGEGWYCDEDASTCRPKE